MSHIDLLERPNYAPHTHVIAPVPHPLHIVAVIDNPERFKTRYRLFKEFADRMEATPGIVFHVVECAFGERHHEVTEPRHPRHYRVRSRHQLWRKENLINIGVRRFPPDWLYGGYVDADFTMTRPDWAFEAVHQLQHYGWVQLFSSYTDLDAGHKPYRTTQSAAMSFITGDYLKGVPPASYQSMASRKPQVKLAATGGGWAWTRDAFDAVGGLMDFNVVGGADWNMFFALAGLWKRDIGTHQRVGCSGFVRRLDEWADMAASTHGRIGCIENHAIHHWHGRKSKRGYGSRWQILTDYAFDPSTDLVYDWQGLLRWAGNKPALEEAVLRYFRSRNEDDVPETPI